MTDEPSEGRTAPIGRKQDAAAADYRVGYSKPPAHSRFRPGQSGNPNGRPKGSKSARSLLDQALSAPVTISEGGRTRVVEQRTALFKALVAKAIKGDARAAALIVRLMGQLDLAAPAQSHQPVTRVIRTIVRPGDIQTDHVAGSARVDRQP